VVVNFLKYENTTVLLSHRIQWYILLLNYNCCNKGRRHYGQRAPGSKRPRSRDPQGPVVPFIDEHMYFSVHANGSACSSSPLPLFFIHVVFIKHYLSFSPFEFPPSSPILHLLYPQSDPRRNLSPIPLQ
jgi:hypothetical protein